MNGELPIGWSQCCVGEVFRSFSGGTPARGNKSYWGGTIPWLSSGDIKTERIQSASETITRAGLDNSSASLCRPGAVVVVVRSGILKHTLPVAVLDREAAINQDIKCFDSGNDELNRWLALALRASAMEILVLNREGTTVQSVKHETLKEFTLLVPPAAERKRIVDTLDVLLPKVEFSRQRLNNVPFILKRFRQSVLAAAFSGDLIADLRGNDDDGWKTARVQDVIEGLKYGTSKKCEYTSKGTPVLRIPNVTERGLSIADLKYAVLPKGELDQLRLREGDILLIRSNGSVSLVGRTALVTQEALGFAYAGYLIRLRPNSKKVLPAFLHLALSAPQMRLQIELEARSTSGVNNINTEEISSLVLHLPPSLEEQHATVSRANAFFRLADQIETRHHDASRRVDNLTQSILAKAFRGELVPQDPKDEPAEKLLERLRAREHGLHKKAAV